MSELLHRRRVPYSFGENLRRTLLTQLFDDTCKAMLNAHGIDGHSGLPDVDPFGHCCRLVRGHVDQDLAVIVLYAGLAFIAS